MGAPERLSGVRGIAMFHHPRATHGDVRAVRGASTIETVFVLVKAKPTLIEPLLQELKAINSVVEARAVTGAWDIVLKLERDYITDALAVVVKDIRSIEGIEATETLVAVNL
jgi:DNA-binding Lrp family transcriptional regulator